MKLKSLLITVLQAVGVLFVAGGVALVAPWAGAVTLGVGMVLFGIALERTD